MEDWDDVFIDSLAKTKFSGFVHNLIDCEHVIREYSYHNSSVLCCKLTPGFELTGNVGVEPHLNLQNPLF